YIQECKFSLARKKFIELLINRGLKGAVLESYNESELLDIFNDFKKALLNALREHRDNENLVRDIMGLIDDMRLAYGRFSSGERNFAVVYVDKNTQSGEVAFEFKDYLYPQAYCYKGCTCVVVPKYLNSWENGFLVYHNGYLVDEYIVLGSKSVAISLFKQIDNMVKLIFRKIELKSGPKYRERFYEETRLKQTEDPDQACMKRKIKDSIELLKKKGGEYNRIASFIEEQVALQAADLREDNNRPIHTFSVSKKEINYFFKAMWHIGLHRQVVYIPKQLVMDFSEEDLAALLYCIGRQFEFLLLPENSETAKTLAGLRDLSHKIGETLVHENPFGAMEKFKAYVNKWHESERTAREALKWEKARLIRQMQEKEETLGGLWLNIINERRSLLSDLRRAEKEMDKNAINRIHKLLEQNQGMIDFSIKLAYLISKRNRLLVKLKLAEDGVNKEAMREAESLFIEKEGEILNFLEGARTDNPELHKIKGLIGGKNGSERKEIKCPDKYEARSIIGDLASISLRLGYIYRILDYIEITARKYLWDAIAYTSCCQAVDTGALPVHIPMKLIFMHIQRGEYCEGVYQLLRLLRADIGRQFYVSPDVTVSASAEKSRQQREDEAGGEKLLYLLYMNKGAVKNLIADACALLKIHSEVSGDPDIIFKANAIVEYLRTLYSRFARRYKEYDSPPPGNLSKYQEDTWYEFERYKEVVINEFDDEPKTLLEVKAMVVMLTKLPDIIKRNNSTPARPSGALYINFIKRIKQKWHSEKAIELSA
ncbi:MAG: hypothetical protein ABIB11_03765, partial [Candidatus Omnitrophota bacterium]